jgi:N6-adenosine-specific RNA methylase IME4
MSTHDPIAREIRRKYARILRLGRKSVAEIIEIGDLLRRKQSQSDHGEWLDWLDTLPLSRATAYRWMRASEIAEREGRTKVLNLRNISAVFRLLATDREILQASMEIRAEQTSQRREERMAKCAEIAQGNGPFPNGRYCVVLADVPWQFEFAPSDRIRVDNHYPVMTLEEIKSLPVTSLAADDAVLLKWCPSCKIAEAIEVMTAWGFTYRTCAVWVKPSMGFGIYWRQQHELLLLGNRGTLPAPAERIRVSSVIDAPRGRHSEKPKLHTTIDNYWPGVPKIELFARDNPPEGWAAWGNQVEIAA